MSAVSWAIVDGFQKSNLALLSPFFCQLIAQLKIDSLMRRFPKPLSVTKNSTELRSDAAQWLKTRNGRVFQNRRKQAKINAFINHFPS